MLAGCGEPEATGVDAASGIDGHAAVCTPTSTDVLGPFYRPGAPSRMTIAAVAEPGDRLVFDGVVVGPDCAPLAGAMLDVWQADKDGRYYEPNGAEPFRLRGRFQAGADGTWQLHTIRPGNYMLDATLWRPAHLHVTVTHPEYRTLTTQLYFEDDPFLPPNDGCTSCGSDDPARILRLDAGRDGLRTAVELVLARA